MTPETTPALAPVAINAFARERLKYVLPDFTRISWVGDRARAAWEPRIQRIGHAWSEIEWRSIIAGIRKCALTSVPADQLVERSTGWAGDGLSTMPVAMSGVAPGYASTSVAPRTGQPFEYRVAIGALADVAALKHAIDAGDDGSMGRLLGFPACCIAFFRTTWVEDACVDTTWAMAAGSASADESGRQIEIDADTPFQREHPLAMDGGAGRAPPALFFYLPRYGGVRDVLMALGREIGYRAEMDWIEEILSWPVSWSALHGIAEVKTPILKASTRTDATASEFVVRRPGAGCQRRPPPAFGFRSDRRSGLV
jgi:hypothetical protein